MERWQKGLALEEGFWGLALEGSWGLALALLVLALEGGWGLAWLLLEGSWGLAWLVVVVALARVGLASPLVLTGSEVDTLRSSIV